MYGDMPARCRQRQDRDTIGAAIPDADMTRLARLAIGRIVHRAVYDVAPGCGPLHPMRQLDAVPYQTPRVRQVAQAERIEVLADRGDDLIVRQPDHMRAALQRRARRLEPQRRDTLDLVQRRGVIEQ